MKTRPILFFATCVSAFSAEARAPNVVLFDSAARSADIIAIVTVESGRREKDDAPFRYEVSARQSLKGQTDMTCLSGPGGLKLGRDYIVILSEPESACALIRQIGAPAQPIAFELQETAGNRYVRIDSSAVVMPPMPTKLAVIVSDETIGTETKVTVGTLVPFDDFVAMIATDVNRPQ